MKNSFENEIWFQKMKGKIEMKNIGAYNGITCFECTEGEYLNHYYSGKMKDDIYIINGTMVRNNKLIGHYDGRKVMEYGGNESYAKPKSKAVEVKVGEAADINFSDYSRVVDEFFENLEKKERKRSMGYLG